MRQGYLSAPPSSRITPCASHSTRAPDCSAAQWSPT
ncbi:hypothetical protein PQA65_gp24 [Yersinia phage vB_YenM_42.18]|uniref:Uncharacterized protein n=1 Tax=Yersinia phage vB_YenM_42.18 TaxID=2918926 RepID=A0AAE9FQ06_9CAUD|nr:hypothetical protein PQA65_gp24 [Yersinia phage vB_YenM_42.18]UNA05738.1 hypothetical protein vBYenM4218_024 [Yersinia phage vB_YenM_42.18]